MTRLAGVIGHPVAHSLSPAMHNAAFRRCGLDAEYQAWDTPPDELALRFAALKRPECMGASITIPHKQAALALLDEAGDTSLASGAVNTVVNRAGRLFGFNTDGRGLVDAMGRESKFDPAGKRVLLLGAGGAARGIALALLEAGSNLVVTNRTGRRAEEMARTLAFEHAGKLRAAPWGESPAAYDCVVNSTSLGMAGPQAETMPACDLSLAQPGTLVVDIVYRPEVTPFLAAAAGLGLPTLPGLPMLVYQGARAFELWTGVSAPLPVMFEAARAVLAHATTPGPR